MPAQRGPDMTRFAMRQRTAEDVQARATQSGSNYDPMFVPGVTEWKCGEGDHAVRFLPNYEEGAKHYAMDIFIHSDVGATKSGYICPQSTLGLPCPICEDRANLERQGETEAAKALKPYKRCICYIIDRDKQQDGPVLWPMPWTLDRDISAASINRRTGALLFVDDWENGYDVYFTRAGSGINTKYQSPQVARDPTPLADDPDLMAKWLEYVQNHPLSSCIVVHPYDKISAVYYGAAPEVDPDLVDTETGEVLQQPEAAPFEEGASPEEQPMYDYPADDSLDAPAVEPEPEPAPPPARPVTRPTTQPAGRPTTQPIARPAVPPVTRPQLPRR